MYYNVTLRHVEVTIFAIPTQQCVLLCYCCSHNVALNNKKPFSVAMEKQQWVHFLLLSRCKIFRTAANNINVLGLHAKRPKSLLDLNHIWSFSTDLLKVFYTKFHENPSSGNRADK